MTGTATISVEIELGWGFHDKADPRAVPELSEDGKKERAALDWLLSVCDDAGVPVTFDIVGHLLLSSCDGDHAGPHPDGWFDRDPGTNAETDPLFYAPHVVEMIRESTVNHEICTHTFSHVLLNEVDEATVNWELNRVRELHDERIVSLVPPRHRKPPYSILRNHGIEVVRRAISDTPTSGGISWFLWNLTRNHPIDCPRINNRIVETHTSSFMTLTASYLSNGVSEPHTAYRLIPKRVRQRRHRNFLWSGLDAVADQESNIHYWTHLYNMAHEVQREPIRNLLNKIGNRNNIEVKRIKDLML